MISLPPKYILDSINGFCILLFKDLNHQKDAPPHFHVVFPVYNDESGLIITIITKQIVKRTEYYKRTNKHDAVEALVPVNNNIFDFLSYPSVADCNHAELLTKTELLKRIDLNQEFKVICRDVPSFFQKEICAAIRTSPLISSYIKKIVKELLKTL